MLKISFVLGVLVAVAVAQRGISRIRPLGDDDDNDRRRITTTPVPILKQINKVNEDGSYTYGYESADGSYKIETKSKEGEVRGKYGYYDDAGVLREIEYGASRQGFHPQGTDVKPPESASAIQYDPFDDTGHYDPERYDKPFAYDHGTAFTSQGQAPRPRAGGRRPGVRRPKQQQFVSHGPAPVQQQQQSHHVVNYQQEQNFAPPQQQYQQQQPYTPPQQQQPVHQPQYVNHNYQPQAPQVPPFHQSQLFHGHPARNIDINTGSYSVQYHG